MSGACARGLAVLLILLSALSASAAPVRIMPIGDSITAGNSAHLQSYRYPLAQKLTAAGIAFDFIGTQNSNSSALFDADHEGHIANDTPAIWGRVNNALFNHGYFPDIALIHAGTNDWYWSGLEHLTEENLRGIITTLRSRNPQVTILLAKLIPIYILPDTTHVHNTRISAINARVDGIAATMSTAASPVIVVDQNTGFNRLPGTDSEDGTHPSPAGEEKMAQLWFDALLPIIGNPVLTAVTIASNHTNPSVARTGDAITLTFTANKPIQTPGVTIAGRPATVAHAGGNTWTATIAVIATDAAGAAPFQISYIDLAGRAGPVVAATSNGSSVAITHPTPFEWWATAYGLTGAAALLSADPDGDGITNVAEFAYDLDPEIGFGGMIDVTEGAIAAHGIPRMTITNTQTGVSIRVIFGRRKDRATAGLTYAVQFSADLTTWVTGTTAPTLLAQDTTLEAVSVPFPFFVAGRKARFFRLVVEIP